MRFGCGGCTMFFGLFKRTPAPAAKGKRPAASAAKSKSSRSSWRATEPDLPAELRSFEVTEGNDSDDWALWQDSVNSFDSRLPSVKLYRHESETPTEFQEVDAFARVRRKD